MGLKGTVVSFPHAEQVVCVSTRWRTLGAPAVARAARFVLHALHRFGSFLKFLSAKNNCSPDVQMNSVAQSTHCHPPRVEDVCVLRPSQFMGTGRLAQFGQQEPSTNAQDAQR